MRYQFNADNVDAAYDFLRRLGADPGWDDSVRGGGLYEVETDLPPAKVVMVAREYRDPKIIESLREI